MVTSIDSLPDDTLSEIFSYFLGPTLRPWPLERNFHDADFGDGEDAHYQTANRTNKLELLHTSQACRRWFTLTQPLLFRSVHIHDNRSLRALQLPLTSESSTPYDFVRHVDMDIPPRPTDYCLAAKCQNVKEVVLWFSRITDGDTTGIVDMLRSMPRLRSLGLVFDDELCENTENNLQVTRLFNKMAAAFGTDASASPGNTLRILELREASLVFNLNALASLLRTSSIRQLSLLECVFPSGTRTLDALWEVGLEALSLDLYYAPRGLDINGLQSFSTLQSLRIGYSAGKGLSPIVDVLPQQIKALCLLDMASRTVASVLAKLGKSENFLPKLEVLGIDTTSGRPFDMFGSGQDLTSGDGENRFRNITNAIQGRMVKINATRKLRLEPADVFERMVEQGNEYYRTRGRGNAEV